MSIESVQKIIGRAMTEAEFRDLLFNDPAKALADYELTEDESNALKELERKNFDTVAQELEQRISRARFGGPGFVRGLNPQPEPP